MIAKIVKSCSSIIILLLSIFLVFCSQSMINYEHLLNDVSDFCFNMISCNSIIAGFIFTGLSILISIIDKERIKRLFDNDYLDNFYKNAIFGILFNIISIFLSFTFLLFLLEEEIALITVNLILASFLGSLFCFIFTIIKLYLLIKKLKSNSIKRVNIEDVINTKD